MKELKSALQQNDLNLAYKLAKKAQKQELIIYNYIPLGKWN